MVLDLRANAPDAMRTARDLMTATGPHPSHVATAKAAHPLISVEATAAMLGVSRMTVDRAIKAGEFPCVKFRRTYRVPRAFVEQVIEIATAGHQVVVEEYAAAWQAQ